MERLIEGKFTLRFAYYTDESYEDADDYLDDAIEKAKEEFANLTTTELANRIKLTIHPWEKEE